MSQRPGTILIADDDANDIQLMQLALSKLGTTDSVQVARDGAEALDYLEGNGRFADRVKYPLPFLVILDWKFLLRSGLEVLTEIRSHPGFERLCVPVFSSSLNPQDKEAAMSAGADIYMLKPSGNFVPVLQEIMEFAQQC